MKLLGLNWGKMDNNLVNYFTPLDGQAYKDVVRYISENNVEVIFKVYDIHSKSSFVQVNGAELAIFKKYSYDYETTSILCTFNYEGERRFFRAKMSTTDNYYLVKFPEKIYKIQRRNDFRFTLPPNMKYEFKILDLQPLEYELRDVSLGGCKVAIKTTSEIPDLKLEQEIRVWMSLLDFGGVTIDATVAFTRFMQEINTQVVGIKFATMEPELLSELHQTLIQVDRLSRK
jgi:hypothetical protein